MNDHDLDTLRTIAAHGRRLRDYFRTPVATEAADAIDRIARPLGADVYVAKPNRDGAILPDLYRCVGQAVSDRMAGLYRPHGIVVGDGEVYVVTRDASGDDAGAHVRRYAA